MIDDGLDYPERDYRPPYYTDPDAIMLGVFFVIVICAIGYGSVYGYLW